MLLPPPPAPVLKLLGQLISLTFREQLQGAGVDLETRWASAASS